MYTVYEYLVSSDYELKSKVEKSITYGGFHKQ